MAMTTVMAVVETTEEGRQALQAAFLAAARDGGHVVGVYPVPRSERITPEKMYFSRASLRMSGEDFSGALNRMEREGGAGVAAARRTFEEVAAAMEATIVERPPSPGSLTAHFIALPVDAPDAVAAHGRVFDLLVTRQPRVDPGHRVRKMVRALLFGAGRPVLVAPPHDPASVGQRPLIAWNGSALSARAAAIARSFFHGAQEVGILSVQINDRSGPSADDLADYIAWHNIKATIIDADLGGLRLGDVFLNEAERFEADLLVMGAYSQSPFRETLTGGVTNHVLSHAELPVLMTC